MKCVLVMPRCFFTYTRMSVERFEYFLGLVGPTLKKRKMRTAISPTQRLTMTLRFLAAGDSQDSLLSFAYRCAQSTVSQILAETMRALVAKLKPAYVKAPSNANENGNKLQIVFGKTGSFLIVSEQLMGSTSKFRPQSLQEVYTLTIKKCLRCKV